MRRTKMMTQDEALKFLLHGESMSVRRNSPDQHDPGSGVERAGCGKGCRVTLARNVVKIPIVVGASPIGRDYVF